MTEQPKLTPSQLARWVVAAMPRSRLKVATLGSRFMAEGLTSNDLKRGISYGVKRGWFHLDAETGKLRLVKVPKK
jgi:hypothetical protein